MYSLSLLYAVTPARFNFVRYLTICLHFKNKLKETLLPSGSLFGVLYIFFILHYFEAYIFYYAFAIFFYFVYLIAFGWIAVKFSYA